MDLSLTDIVTELLRRRHSAGAKQVAKDMIAVPVGRTAHGGGRRALLFCQAFRPRPTPQHLTDTQLHQYAPAHPRRIYAWEFEKAAAAA